MKILRTKKFASLLNPAGMLKEKANDPERARNAKERINNLGQKLSIGGVPAFQIA